jgi:SAM-dependent methyltransferase
MRDERLPAPVPPQRRFDGLADDYARWRPGYPAALVDAVLARAGPPPPGAVVADLGCGTGIASRLFAARGLRVVGVDPSEAMLDAARSAGGGPTYRRGDAAATGLADACAFLAVAAQAFHWFEVDPTLAELRRILVPGGTCAAFWNCRRPSPFTDALDALLKRSSTEHEVVGKGRGVARALAAHPGVRDAEALEIPWSERLPLEAVLGRLRSASYVEHGVADRETFEREARALVEDHAVGGTVEWPLDTVAVVFRPR